MPAEFRANKFTVHGNEHSPSITPHFQAEFEHNTAKKLLTQKNIKTLNRKNKKIIDKIKTNSNHLAEGERRPHHLPQRNYKKCTHNAMIIQKLNECQVV